MAINLCETIISIDEKETAGELHDKLKNLGAKLIVKTIAGLAEGNIEEKPQLTTHNSRRNATTYN